MRKKHIIASLFGFTGFIGATRLANRSFSPSRFMILMYHRLRSDGEPNERFSDAVFGPSVSLFELQMRHLKERYSVVSTERLVASLRGEDSLPSNAVAVTFDDGYADTYALAYPVLKKYDLPATVFLATGFVGTNDLLWYDKVAYLLHRTSRESISLNGADYSLRTLPERRKAARKLTEGLKQVSEAEKSGLLEELQRACGVELKGRSFKLALSWDEVREMARNGISFGAHTVNHPILTRVSKETARRELLESKSTIERELQAPVRLFSYPNGELGDFNEETRSLVKECGYDAACTSVYGPNLPISDRFALRRIWIGPNDSLPIFSAKLVGIFPLRTRLKQALQLRAEPSK